MCDKCGVATKKQMLVVFAFITVSLLFGIASLVCSFKENFLGTILLAIAGWLTLYLCSLYHRGIK